MPAPYNPLNIKKYDPFLKPIERPGVDPDEGTLVCVQVNEAWIPALIGALWPLRYTDKWQGSPSERTLETQRVENLIYMLAVAGECDDVQPVIPQFRFTEACGMESSVDDGVTWSPVPGWDTYAAACFTGPEGPPGAPGQDGTDGAPGKSIPPGSAANQGDGLKNSDSDHLCGAAVTYANWLLDTAGDTIDVAQAALSAGEAAIDMTSLPIAWIPVIGDEYRAWVEFAFSAGQAIIDAVRADDTTARREQLACEIFCILKCAHESESPAIITDSDIAAIRGALSAVYDDIPPGASLLWYLESMFDDIDLDEHKGRLAVYSLDSSEQCGLCDDCGCDSWCRISEFGVDLDGWVIAAGNQVSAGVDGVDVGNYYDLNINRDFAQPVNITEIRMTFTTEGPRSGLERAIWATINGVRTQLIPITAANTCTDCVAVWTGSENVTRIELWNHALDDYNAPRINNVTVRGVGPNPFGESNCT